MTPYTVHIVILSWLNFFFSLIFIHKTVFTSCKWLDFSVNLPVTNQVIRTSSDFLPWFVPSSVCKRSWVNRLHKGCISDDGQIASRSLCYLINRTGGWKCYVLKPELSIILDCSASPVITGNANVKTFVLLCTWQKTWFDKGEAPFSISSKLNKQVSVKNGSFNQITL